MEEIPVHGEKSGCIVKVGDAHVSAGDSGVGKMAPMQGPVCGSGTDELANSFIPMTSQAHDMGCSLSHYPDAHWTGDFDETEETGREDRAHGEGAISTERVDWTCDTSLEIRWEAWTEVDSWQGIDHCRTPSLEDNDGRRPRYRIVLGPL